MQDPPILRQDIAPGLVELDSSDPETQVAFWTSCVHRRQPELHRIGGLPVDRVANDLLTRYFDSSTHGLNVIYRAAARDQAVPGTLLDKDGLYDALSEHLMFFEVLSTEEKNTLTKDGSKLPSNVHFERVCEKVGMPCSQASFGYAVRALRKATLLDHFALNTTESHEKSKVYHCDYDDDFIHTPFEKSARRRPMYDGKDKYHVPIISKQVPIGKFSDYLFTSKYLRKGRVHWSHLQFPSTELLLACGQVWRLPGPCLTVMTGLDKAQPQLCIHHKWSGEESSDYAWSHMVLPSIRLDSTSRANLDVYRQWFQNIHESAQKGVDAPPRVHVAVTRMNLALMWSSGQANTLISSSEAAGYYIGRWTTDSTAHEISCFQSLLNKLTCAGAGVCCMRRKRSDGYEKVPTNDPDDMEKQSSMDKCNTCGKKHSLAGISIDHDLHMALKSESEDGIEFAGQQANDDNVSCTSFEKTFEQVLNSLENQNSALRIGDHYHLLFRIVLNRTNDYMDVLELYEAAIRRLNYVLHDAHSSHKDDLITKIEKVKLELITLERVVQPFAEYVVPELYSFAQTIQHQHPLVFHHVKEIQNNVRAFLPKSAFLISRCENRTDEYDRMAQGKMNNILNILTFITFVITPMQLMTGIYGMNFRIMPELDWKHGYLGYWWGLCLTLTALFAMILVCLQRR